MAELKLPLYPHSSHLCDPDFKGDHTYVIKEVHKNGKIVAECTGCGIEWNGCYKKHWMPDRVGLALMEAFPEIKLKRSGLWDGGYVY